MARGPAAPQSSPPTHARPPPRWLQGGAPEGLKFVDTEEEWVVDAATGQGAWLPVKR